MTINRQAERWKCGRSLTLVLLVVSLGAPVSAGGPSTAMTNGVEEPLTAMSLPFRLETERSALQVTDGPGLNGPRLFTHQIRRETGFLGRHLAPRLTRQMGGLIPIHALESHRAPFERSAIHNGFTGTVGYFAERGARKAVGDYFLEETGLGAVVESVRGRHRSTEAPVASLAQPSSIDFGVGISGGRPRIEMRRRSGAGSTRVRVGLDGYVSIVFVPAHAPDALLVASYDRSQSLLGLVFSHSF